MPTRSRGKASKLTPRFSTASSARRLGRASRPKRGPSRAAPRSASVTVAAALMKMSVMAEDERAVNAAKTGVELQDATERGGGPRFLNQRGGGKVRARRQSRRAGQHFFL